MPRNWPFICSAIYVERDMPQLADCFKALADPNRLRIVNILSHRSVCVCDLQFILGLSQPFISRHLAYLRKVGLVHDRRDGPRVCYSLALETPLGPSVKSFLREALATSPVFQADVRRLIEASAAGRLKSNVLEIRRGELERQAA
jgi:ArsR family transcriptional regulator